MASANLCCRVIFEEAEADLKWLELVVAFIYSSFLENYLLKAEHLVHS
jgi:hypothetical protein